LVVAMMILASHICVLPSHHHDETSARNSDEAMNDASCEGLPSASTPCPIVTAGNSVTVPMHTAVMPVWGGQGRPTTSLKSPPLFLLHASLLI